MIDFLTINTYNIRISVDFHEQEASIEKTQKRIIQVGLKKSG